MKIVIIGNGISGITAARWIRKLSDHEITVISSESDYFFSRTALMYIYMGHMRLKDTQPYENWFWEKNRIGLKRAHIDSIDPANNEMVASDGEIIAYDKLIIATGSKTVKYGWPGQDLEGAQGLYSLQDLEKMEKASPNLSRAVIVGGGLIGIEMAEMFLSRNIPVTMLVRENSFWNNVLPPEESSMINQHVTSHGLDLRLETELESAVDDGTGKVKAIVTNHGETIPCEFLGITTGVAPNVDFLKPSGIVIEKGILVDEYLRTNYENIYAIGDCAQIKSPHSGRRPVEAIWYTGRMMGEVVAYNVCGKEKSYNPGLWFNSAKFFDIEYQVYGLVPSKPIEGIDSLVWINEGKDKSIRLVYSTADQKIIGFNLMGIRFRHEVCERWITSGTDLNDVIKNLSLAFFDPEFYSTHGFEVVKAYQLKTGNAIKPVQSDLNRTLQFLKA